jgi:hypothetical protein
MKNGLFLKLLKVREKELHDESENENEEDDTLCHYCSEDGAARAEVDCDNE